MTSFTEDDNSRRRRRRLIAGGAALVLLVAGSWFCVRGVWYPHARAVSPGGQRIVESRNLYRWGLTYGWNRFHVRVLPAARIRCKTLHGGWRGTSDDIGEWKFEHRYANYNDFDRERRKPTGLRWLDDHEFVIDGGEGDGSVFEVER